MLSESWRMNPRGVPGTNNTGSPGCLLVKQRHLSEPGPTFHPAHHQVQQQPQTLKGVSTMTKQKGRVIGLDAHPDSFAGAILRGRDPATAQIENPSTRVALPQLEDWAERHTCNEDVLVLEASGNTFAVAEWMRKTGRKVVTRDSHRTGKVG